MNFLQKISITRLVLIITVFLTVTGNTKFFSETLVVYPWSDNVLFLVSLAIWLFSFLAILLLVVSYRYSVKPILIALLLISSIVSYFANNYGIVIDDNMIANSMETNMAESIDLFSLKLVFYFLILGVIPAYWVYKVQISHSKFSHQLWSKLKVIIILIVVFVVVTLTFSKSYTSFARENKQLRLHINPTYYLYAVGKYINSQFETASIPFSKIGGDAKVVRGDKGKKLVIVIAGETARSDRFSLNGYHRQTNPLLAKENVISFKQMSSCGTDTALSLPCMFSSLNRENYSHAQGKNMSNVLDILSYAGVEVLWRDNNSSSKNVADRLPSQNYKSDNINTVCDIECRDEGMLSDLQQYIDNYNDKDILIVLHTMGSHGPAYYKRYPRKFERFTPVCRTNQLNECTNEQINNAYDNTIVYTDYILSKTIEFLRNNQDEYRTAMFYMSDHGESLGENGLYLHGMPYFIAPEEQTQVASVLWFGDKFSQEVDITKLKNSSNKSFSHDGFFHTLLGLMNVRTDLYNKKLDFIPYMGFQSN
jgi:lipid A ethanolaminephosphotransferase